MESDTADRRVMEQPASAVIEIRRPSRAERFADSRAKYKVRIDGQSVGTVRAGETVRFPVQSGEHTVSLHQAWVSSPSMPIVAVSGRTTTIEAEPSRPDERPTMRAGLRDLKGMTLDRKRGISLRQI